MIDAIRDMVRNAMTKLARILNKLSRGRLSPDVITAVSLLGHFIIVWTLFHGQFRLSGLLLVIFGLMDALDGALARVQGVPKATGMFLDASSDRVKEAMIYAGILGYMAANLSTVRPWGLEVPLLALAGSMLVSYVKAKGETALTDTELSANEKNVALRDGFARYEIRMALLVGGLLLGKDFIAAAVTIVAVLAWCTALDRFVRIYKRLRSQ